VKLAYRWRCFACDAANAASATSCSSCGFPAKATGAEIARAQAAHRIGVAPSPRPGRPDRPPTASLAQALASWRGWRLGVAIAGAVLLAIGAFAGNGVLSWAGLGISVLALIFGLVLLLIAWAARGVTPAAYP
jgi:hypothetical protein